MIKDRLTEAIEANYEKILKGDDHIPIGMRGELEVIVKDRDGNIKSYERDHNQVTKLAKMALLHLLAGEIGTHDSDVYSVPEGTGINGRRVYAIDNGEAPSPGTKIVSYFTPENHTTTQNLDGQMVSGLPYFFSGTDVQNNTNKSTKLSQVAPFSEVFDGGKHLSFNFPTKMLFGTGLEDHDLTSVIQTYTTDFGTSLSSAAILVLNGYSASYNSGNLSEDFFKGCSSDTTVSSYDISQDKRLSNWYSADAYRCRTLQPASTNAMKTNPTSDDTALKGAIKNCFIESTSDDSLYNPTTKMAMAPYRGYGYPCFIYATRSTDSFYKNEDGNREVYYGLNDALGSSVYETEVTYTVVMPAQPVASNNIATFYPYNGWVLRQAGLFCDSRYKIRTVPDNDATLGESTFISRIQSSDPGQSNNAHTYRDSVGGQMLFTRNLSSPILKTADDEVTFIWHIFITV